MPIYKMPGKKDGKQKYRVRVNYKKPDGTNAQTDRVAAGLEEAKFLELQLLSEFKSGTPDTRMTVLQLFEECMMSRKAEVRETTLEKSRQIAIHHILPTLGKYQLKKLTPKTLDAWKIEINNKSLSLNMRKNIYANLRLLINYALKMDYLSKNPLDKVGNFKDPCEFKKDMDYYTVEEFSLFLKAARQSAETCEQRNILGEWDYYVFFAIAFYTGLRKGEIHGLEWSDIENDYLSVKRSVAQKLKGGDRETPPKNQSSIRTLQLPLPLIQILSEHKNRWKNADGFNNSFKVCGGFSSLRDSSIENKNRRYASAAGVKKIRIHDFRHSHASLLANAGINIQEISRRLGHSNVEITWNTYSHLYPKEEERAIAVLNHVEPF